MSGIQVVESAADMKSIIILAACDIIEKLTQMGEKEGAYALAVLVQTIEQIPCAEVRK